MLIGALEQCEAELTAARARIAKLENGLKLLEAGFVIVNRIDGQTIVAAKHSPITQLSIIKDTIEP